MTNQSIDQTTEKQQYNNYYSNVLNKHEGNNVSSRISKQTMYFAVLPTGLWIREWLYSL